MGGSYLLAGGRILTGAREVEALVLEEGRVVAAGSTAEAHRVAPTGTEVIDLRGHLVIPGLIDAHLHLAELTRAREGLGLRNVRSFPELRARLADWSAEHSRGLVTGDGWAVEQFVERREPTLAEVEGAVPDRPVVLYHASGHAAVLNRLALEAAGYSDRTPNPPGGRLGRAPDGRLNGLVYETALAPVRRLTASAHPPDPAALGRTVRLLNSLGVTAVGSLNTAPDELRAIRAVWGTHRPTLRVRCYARLAHWSEFAGSEWIPLGTDGFLGLVGVKGFVDGAFGPRTAWLDAPYADLPGESGVPVLREAELIDLFERCAREGRQPAVHAIGDRALVEVLRALDRLGSRAPPFPRIEHASLVPPSSLPLLDRLRPLLVVQPGFVWSDDWLGQRLGGVRARWAYPFRTLTAHGHRLAGSTDAPYDPADPWRGLAAAVSRTAPEGGSANPTAEEALSAPAALALFTGNAGRALGDPRLGSLEPGACADLVVLAAPDLERALRSGGSSVVETWVAGARAFERAARADPTTI
jgi:predicted amidohydrolase YtcJ